MNRIRQISVSEYDRIRVSDDGVGSCTLTSREARSLRTLNKIHGREIFKFADEESLIAQQFVGVAQVEGLLIEVLPKIDDLDESNARYNLVGMLCVALGMDISEGHGALVGRQNFGLLEVLIRIFCDKLGAQLKRGIHRQYESEEENLHHLQGRIAVAEQIRKNSANPERLFCRYEVLKEDCTLNRVLKAATRLLLSLSKHVANYRSLMELHLMFESVEDISPRTCLTADVPFNRLNERFKQVFQLAQLFLSGEPPDVGKGSHQSFALFFDMNVLFEEYIGRMAARHLSKDGCAVRLQGPHRHLAKDEADDRDVFTLRPDVVGMIAGQPSWIIDTKWKVLKPGQRNDGVIQSDLYQMYAYSKCYDCPDVLLLYPHHKELGDIAGIRTSYRLTTFEPNLDAGEFSRVQIATIDIKDLAKVPGQLQRLIRARKHIGMSAH